MQFFLGMSKQILSFRRKAYEQLSRSPCRELTQDVMCRFQRKRREWPPVLFKLLRGRANRTEIGLRGGHVDGMSPIKPAENRLVHFLCRLDRYYLDSTGRLNSRWP